MHMISGNSVYKRIPTGKSDPLVEITGNWNDPLQIRVRHPNGPLPDEEAEAIKRYVREMFDLDTDLAPFYVMADQDALLGVVAKQFHGLRVLGIPDLFEALCWGILGQQINLAFAYTLKRRFVEKYGHSIEYNGAAYWTFPDPRAIAELSPQDLTSLQITGRKAEYLIGTARLIAEGSLSKDKLLAAKDVKEAERLLTGIRGIGPWTANYVLMRCLKVPSAFPIDDVGLHNAIKAVLGMSDKPKVAYIRQLSAGWAGWEAYATFYLWRYLY